MNRPALLRLTRRLVFRALSVRRGAGLTAAPPRRLFERAGEAGPYGQTYHLEVAYAGPVDPRSGMVVNIKLLDARLAALLRKFEGRLWPTAFPKFRNNLPTAERLALLLWSRLPVVGAARPRALRLEEEPGLAVELESEEPRMMLFTRSVEFSAAHRLQVRGLSAAANRRLFGKCNRPNFHGHNYVVEVTVRGEPDERLGMVAHLDALDAILKRQIEDRFDHTNLNLDSDLFARRVPTAENIALVIWELLAPRIPACRVGGPVALHRVRVIETARSWFDYYGPEREPFARGQGAAPAAPQRAGRSQRSGRSGR